jgi:BirA family transcriptional regulator, biotin operon repressor / biotin---[acetyl-CoA-carboxylase] ligase
MDRTVSTMDVLHAMAMEGAETGTAVVAEEQTGGRGSRGRLWLSPRGGLWLSVLLRPAAASGLDLLSLRAGLAAAEWLSAAAGGEPITVKWPNDLMLGDRKVGGILCEARWQGDMLGWVVVGLGLNVTNLVPDSLGEVATNLAGRVPGLSPADLAGPLAAELRGVITDAAWLSEEELARFDARDWLRGRNLKSPALGVADGIAPDGALRLRLPSGSEAMLRAGPVELADSPVRG